jgi:hypothetical protein
MDPLLNASLVLVNLHQLLDPTRRVRRVLAALEQVCVPRMSLHVARQDREYVIER